jgi:NAD(P)-dependent dehydrogenase (short-subunit alcohol dehydrogenase family)
MSLTRPVALITGASRGLGRAVAHALHARGYVVVGVARDGDALAAALPIGAVALAGDIADPDLPARAAGLAWSLGPLELVVHCASTLGPVPLRPLLDHDDADLQRVFEVNVFGPLRLLRATVGAMALRGRGAVLLISSDAAVAAYPGWGPYGASKAAMDHLGRTLAAELADSGARVLSVDPGEMATAMHADALPDADPTTLADPADVAARLLDLLDDPIGAPSGARLVAATWGAA